jgi:hypothetical protein
MNESFKKVQINSTGLHATRLGLDARGIVDPFVQVSRRRTRVYFVRSLNYLMCTSHYCDL